MPWPGGFDTLRKYAREQARCSKCEELSARNRELVEALEKIRSISGRSTSSWAGVEGTAMRDIWETSHAALT